MFSRDLLGCLGRDVKTMNAMISEYGRLHRFMLCNSAQGKSLGRGYSGRVMSTDGGDIDERLARIEQMIEEFREAKQRELVVRRRLRLWRGAQARRQMVVLEAEPERIH